MEQENETKLDEMQKLIFEKINKNGIDEFKTLIVKIKGGVNFVDDNGMTPLQHACCKGIKEAVAILLDMGADINHNQHGANYTPLHFAALSGNVEICRMLLDAGINPNSVNSVSRTASQMAAFVGYHNCVETINNYISKSKLEYYTKPHGQQKEPYLPPSMLNAFHSFVIEVNLHPVRLALNLEALGLVEHMNGLKKALRLMCEKEMKKTHDINELMAYKYHYQSWIISELQRCDGQSKGQQQQQKVTSTTTKSGKIDNSDLTKHDFVELFIKRVLKENKVGQLDYLEYTIRECAREFPFRECTIFRQIVTQLASKDALPALIVLRNAINGPRGFIDESTYCSTCGKEKPDKKCSKCKAVQYCDRECQRLHWFMHKKSCARPSSSTTTTNANVSQQQKGPIDVHELREELTKIKIS